MTEIRCNVHRDPRSGSLDIIIVRDNGPEEPYEILVPKLTDLGVEYAWIPIDNDEKRSYLSTFSLSSGLLRRGLAQQLLDGISEVMNLVPSGTAPVKGKEDLLIDHLNTMKELLFKSDFVRIERGNPLQEVIE